MDTYKKPILVSVLHVIGMLNAAAAIIMMCISFSQGPVGTMPGILTALAGAITVTLFFGLAQCVDYLGRTAYHTERTADLLERQSRLASPQPRTIKDDAWRRAQQGE